MSVRVSEACVDQEKTLIDIRFGQSSEIRLLVFRNTAETLMNTSISQQIIISGVGGQGVLFVTRLLAETAIMKNLPVFTSEIHGMAQRGGTVVSHLKVGTFSSPMIRPCQADGMMALKAENVALHGGFVKPGGWIVSDSDRDVGCPLNVSMYRTDAHGLARTSGHVKSANLILLGFALARLPQEAADAGHGLFCDLDDIIRVLNAQPSAGKRMLEASVEAIRIGYNQGS